MNPHSKSGWGLSRGRSNGIAFGQLYIRYIIGQSVLTPEGGPPAQISPQAVRIQPCLLICLLHLRVEKQRGYRKREYDDDKEHDPRPPTRYAGSRRNLLCQRISHVRYASVIVKDI